MRKISLFVMVLAASGPLTGCETVTGTVAGAVTGASVGMKKDAENISNPDKNGWNAAKKADAWMQSNLW